MSAGRHDELITAAAAVVRPRRVGDRLCADVGAAIVSGAGRTYRGVCIDTACGTGFCAEHAAAAAMVTAGEYRIRRVVAVWRDDAGRLTVLPPCGRCRQFLRQLHPDNLEAEVVLGRDRSMTLRELLPAWEWPEPLDPDPGTVGGSGPPG